MRRRSVVSGFRVVTNVVGPVTVALYDGAEAVPVADRDDPFAAKSWQAANGTTWQTLCYCGPAATLPMRIDP